jgi:hypothetical protein
MCVEPVPDNSANAVKVAVAKNFEELVTKSEKVQYYILSLRFRLFFCLPAVIGVPSRILQLNLPG